MVDNRAPRVPVHLKTKSKKEQNKIDRHKQIQENNRILLQKILKIDYSKSQLNTLNLLRQNPVLGLGTLNRVKRIKELIQITHENKVCRYRYIKHNRHSCQDCKKQIPPTECRAITKILYKVSITGLI